MMNFGMNLFKMAESRRKQMVSGGSDVVKNAGKNNPFIPQTSLPVSNPGSSDIDYSPSSGGFDRSTGYGVFGSLLNAGANIVGGLFNYNSQKKANAIAEKQFRENLAFQKDQFYNAMQHRVADAKKAGVHPLAALGISAHGSASPTAHVQAATGLGHALQAAGGAVNDFFNNRIKFAQLDLLDSQIATQKALAIKYGADASRSMADASLMSKDLANYHLYRAWDRVNTTIGRLTGVINPARITKNFDITNNRDYGNHIKIDAQNFHHDKNWNVDTGGGMYQRVY